MMALLSKAVTTLNIEASGVRFLTVRQGRVETWGSAPLPPGLVRDTLIADPAAVGEIIGDLLGSAGLSRHGVIVSLTGLRSVSRLVSLPRLSASRMKEAVRWAARREMPVALNELCLSWQTVGTWDSEQWVFLLGTPRSVVDATLGALSAGGIKPHAMDLKPLALARMVGRSEAIIVDLESESMTIVIVVKGITQLMHTIVTRQDGLLLDDRMRRLADDLSRTVMFYNNAHPDQPLNPGTAAFFTGEVANDPAVHRLARSNIEYAVEYPTPCVECPAGLPVPQYAVNLGLALREMPLAERGRTTAEPPCVIRLDIVPGDYVRRWKRDGS
jgi:type IV pilus assembly protein PilM